MYKVPISELAASKCIILLPVVPTSSLYGDLDALERSIIGSDDNSDLEIELDVGLELSPFLEQQKLQQSPETVDNNNFVVGSSSVGGGGENYFLSRKHSLPSFRISTEQQQRDDEAPLQRQNAMTMDSGLIGGLETFASSNGCSSGIVGATAVHQQSAAAATTAAFLLTEAAASAHHHFSVLSFDTCLYGGNAAGTGGGNFGVGKNFERSLSPIFGRSSSVKNFGIINLPLSDCPSPGGSSGNDIGLSESRLVPDRQIIEDDAMPGDLNTPVTTSSEVASFFGPSTVVEPPPITSGECFAWRRIFIFLVLEVFLIFLFEISAEYIYEEVVLIRTNPRRELS